MLVLATLGAPERRRLRGRRRRPREAVPEPPPEAVLTTRATVIDAERLDDAEAGETWLAGADADAQVATALRLLNRVVHLHRIAAADAAPRDVTRPQALAVRVGFGRGEEVAEGRWSRALTVPELETARSRGRTAVLRPQERLAALLGGRDAALACEDLALRARADVTAGRWREAALTLRVTVPAAVAELEPWAAGEDLAARIAELRSLRPEADAVADRALERGLDPGEQEAVERVLGRVEAALRARTTLGLD